jgi:ketosteroid isomerase-like protein
MRKIAMLMVFFLIVSCNNQNQSKPMDTTKNEQLIKQYFEHFNNHDWKKMSEMYTDTADKYAELNSAFPDLHDKVIQVYPSGDKHIIVEFVSSGTAPDNSKFELPICTIFTIENGLITKDFTYFDNFEEEEN